MSFLRSKAKKGAASASESTNDPSPRRASGRYHGASAGAQARDWSQLSAEEARQVTFEQLDALNEGDIEKLPQEALLEFRHTEVLKSRHNLRLMAIQMIAVNAKAAEEAQLRKLADEKLKLADEKAAESAREAAEEARLRKLADEKAAEEARLRKLADEKAAEEARLRKLADEKSAESAREAAEEARLRKLADEKSAVSAREAAEQTRLRTLAEERLAKVTHSVREIVNRMGSTRDDATQGALQIEFRNMLDERMRHMEELLNATEAMNFDETTVADAIKGKPILTQKARPAWGDNLSDNSSLQSKRSTVSAPVWLEFTGDSVDDWNETEFVSFLKKAPNDLVQDLMQIPISAIQRQMLDGSYAGNLVKEFRFVQEAVVERVLQHCLWNPLENLTLQRGCGFKIQVPTGESALGFDVAIAPQFAGTLKPDRIIVTKRNNFNAILGNDGINIWDKDQGFADYFDSESGESKFGQNKEVVERIRKCLGIVVVEVKPDYVCPVPKYFSGRSHSAEEANRRNEAVSGGFVRYLKSTAADGVSDEDRLKYNPVSQVGTYAAALGMKYVAVCTLNGMTYGSMEVRRKDHPETVDVSDMPIQGKKRSKAAVDEKGALAEDPDVMQLTARTERLKTSDSKTSNSGMKKITVKTEHFMHLTRKFDWSNPEPPLSSETWSHWEVLIRFLLASIDNCFLEAVPDTFKLKAHRNMQDKKEKWGPNDDGTGDGSGGGNAGDVKSTGASSTSFSGANAEGGSSASSSRRGSQSSSSKKRPSKDANEATEKSFAPICWAELWDERRFAIPATHSIEEENTREHLPGDAILLSRSRTGPVYRQQRLRGEFDAVVKVALVHDLKRTKEDPTFDEILQELEKEAAVYGRLKRIQGKYIPCFFWQGNIIDGMIAGLATEFSGTPLNEGTGVTNEVVVKCLEALDQIHGEGVLHGDLKLDNAVLTSSGEVHIIDFGFSSFREHFQDEAAFTSAAHAERVEFEALLKRTMSMSLPLLSQSKTGSGTTRKRRLGSIEKDVSIKQQ